MKPISELRKQLTSAATNGRQARVGQLLHEITARESMNPAAIKPVIDVVRSLEQRLRAGVEDNPTRDHLMPIARQGVKDIRAAFAESLRARLLHIRKLTGSTLQQSLTIPQLRQATQLSIDRTGRVKPRAGRMPAKIQDPTMGREDILNHASPLLVLVGDSTLEKQAPSITAVTGTPESGVNRLLRSSLDGSGTWTHRLAENTLNPQRLVGGLLRRLRAGQETTQFIRQQLGLKTAPRRRESRFAEPTEPVTGPTGTLRRLQTVMRHEGLKALGADLDSQREPLGDVFIGYILHSMFDDDTRPDHAARDGARFYRDNREGSYRKWRFRIVPPYAINCLCFTSNLYETPDGEEYAADFDAVPRYRGVRYIEPQDVGRKVWSEIDGGFVRITPDMVGEPMGRNDRSEFAPRDVGSWAMWFDSQHALIRETLMGSERWAAGARTYADMVDTDGKVISAKRLEAETPKQRERRRKKVQKLLKRLDRLQRKSIEYHGQRWKLGAEEEDAYRRRLNQYLNRARQLV